MLGTTFAHAARTAVVQVLAAIVVLQLGQHVVGPVRSIASQSQSVSTEQRKSIGGRPPASGVSCVGACGGEASRDAGSGPTVVGTVLLQDNSTRITQRDIGSFYGRGCTSVYSRGAAWAWPDLVDTF